MESGSIFVRHIRDADLELAQHHLHHLALERLQASIQLQGSDLSRAHINDVARVANCYRSMTGLARQLLLASKVKLLTASPIEGNRIKDLALAKHRFSSSQKPLGRFVLLLDAILATAHEIIARRPSNPEARYAYTFLEFFNEEQYITLAMLADAGDEAASLVRFFDSEAYDVASAPAEIRVFLERADFLFLQRGAEQTGYTRYAVTLMRSSTRIVNLPGGRFKRIGGALSIDSAMLDRCFARMAGWVHLAGLSIKAEFPDWELLAAFGAMNLSPLPSQAEIDTSLRRLSSVFGLSYVHLKSEFEDFQRFAIDVYHRQSAKEPLSCYRAWAHSVQRMAGARDRRSVHPSTNLLPLLARYGAFCGATTSGVERTFKDFCKQANGERGAVNNDMVNCELKLRSEVLPGDVPRLVTAARDIWQECFGAARCPGTERRWVSGKVMLSKRQSETAWLKGRRSLVATMTKSSIRRSPVETSAVAFRLSRIAWTSSHQTVAPRVLNEIVVLCCVCVCDGLV